jgi:hypothetical protein
MPNLYLIHDWHAKPLNLTVVFCVMFTTGMASIQLVCVSMATNKNLNPPGALGRTPTMLIPYIVTG